MRIPLILDYATPAWSRFPSVKRHLNPSISRQSEAAVTVEPFILTSEGRTYVPARYITEGLNYNIDFTQKDGQMYVMLFTKGQSQAEIKEALEELVSNGNKPVKPPVEIKDGKLTAEQVKQIQNGVQKVAYEATFNWVREQPDDPEFLEFTRLIKQKLGQDAITHEHLIYFRESGTYYLALVPKENRIYKVSVGMLVDDSYNVIVEIFYTYSEIFNQ